MLTQFSKGNLIIKRNNQSLKVLIPAAGPWDTTSGPRPGRKADRGYSPAPLTKYPLLITYVIGFPQQDKIIIALRIF
jgi:hypothetical protein